ncbi:MAG: hypothetical protein AABY55_01335 [Candidatus Omnitrophota bacterium]
MRRMFNFFYAFLLALLGIGATLMAEDITLTTYYPAPYGAYDELSTTGKTCLATTSGNVGIGTTNPTEKLDMEDGNIGDVNTIKSKPGSQPLRLQAMGSLLLSADANNDDATSRINFYIDGEGDAYMKMTINATGNVGIGTTSPSYKLDVAGDINTTGDVRRSGVAYVNPDYVFEPGYKLMNIAEVKNYVLANKHLPNMPSSEEIKTNGVKIFEQNRLLLEKLEEAYLHIFQLEERIAKLERR